VINGAFKSQVNSDLCDFKNSLKFKSITELRIFIFCVSWVLLQGSPH
jgi:hypothetical protein